MTNRLDKALKAMPWSDNIKDEIKELITSLLDKDFSIFWNFDGTDYCIELEKEDITISFYGDY